MAELFASGTLIKCIVGLLCAEAAALAILRKRARLVLGYWDIVASLGAGAALLMALESALRGKSWPWLAIWLALAFVLHIVDISRRLSAPTGSRLGAR